MKTFQKLIEETLDCEDLEELEAAADLFQFGIEKGYYNKRHVYKFNDAYWSVKNRHLAHELGKEIKASKPDIANIVANAPNDIKDDKEKLKSYVNGRLKALKGKIHGIK
ncbi:hypothetical protein SAMN02745163_02437 [Clostridium cavendishii DSM 21758]|uniref:Uncharacterized protein n=1 Tax=Clostridium cavendishii DSM 21758 TaxID=1121302 RepID=A0A1M6LN25_9CLOT|nr:hypothetical protein [Clostridium cavendishii]SHJ72629.1 hypothetical protein SAMN02745163_02437 [Clostridium cavendishii DSM 21758]